MGQYTELKQTIDEKINTNGNQEITGEVLNGVLNLMVELLGNGATFAGMAHTNLVPEETDANVFYIATVPGTYSGFGELVVPKGTVAVFTNVSGTWEMVTSPVVGAPSGNGGEIFNDYENNQAGEKAHSEGNRTQATGAASHSEGNGSQAEGNYAHAEGYNTTASGDYGSHAEGYNTTASGQASHAEGRTTTASGQASHAEGYGSRASGSYGSHAEGYNTTASGDYGSHAEGQGTTASGQASHAEGSGSQATGVAAHASGVRAIASGDTAHAMGAAVYAESCREVVIGQYNERDSSPTKSYFDVTKKAFSIGNGTSENVRSDAFKILGNGTVYADNTTIQPMADYAEMFEWADGNPDEEDRIGYFVTLQGNKIKKATGADEEYILGIISGTAAIIGDAPMRWNDKYLTDEWGRPIYETIQFTEIVLQPKLDDDGNTVYDDDGNPVSEEVEIQKQAYVRKVNPEYNQGQEYIPREQRPEWGVVGLLGKVLVRQDGTLAAGGFCKPNSEGIATKSDSGYYVLEVKNGTQARVLVK